MKLELEIYTDDDVASQLCMHYWQLDGSGKFSFKLSELTEKYNLPAGSIRKLVNSSCTAFSKVLPCIQCGESHPFKNRSDYMDNFRNSSWVCDPCIEINNENKVSLQEKENQLKFNLINDEYQRKREKGLNIGELSFMDAVYLLSIIRAGGSEDLSCIFPCWHYEAPLSPRREYDRQILEQLYYAGAICIHPQSRMVHIILAQENPNSYQFYPLRVHWLLPLSASQKHSHIVEELEKILSGTKWPSAWISEAKALRARIALEESLQYLEYVLSEHGFNLNVGEKTVQVIKSLLNDFSVAQIYNFSWRAAKDAAAFLIRKNVSKQHAVNTVPGSIQRMAEKAISEGWEIKPYGRNFNIPQCMVSQVLYNTTLRIGDAGFNQPVPDE